MLKYFLFFVFCFSYMVYAQTNDIEIGTKPMEGYRNNNGGSYDYSDPEAVNIKVSVWGFVKFPGRYTIPENTTVRDLLSYAGGPTDYANLDELKIYRVGKDSTRQVIPFDYNDLLWERELRYSKENIPKLQATDVLLVPGKRRMYFQEWASLTLSIVSALVSIGILVINITKK